MAKRDTALREYYLLKIKEGLYEKALYSPSFN